MISKVNSMTNSSAGNVNNSSKSNNISFGIKRGCSYISNLAYYSQDIYKLKNNMTFYKIFPFLNPKPKTVALKYETELVGEKFIGKLDITEKVAKLKKVHERLSKRNKV